MGRLAFNLALLAVFSNVSFSQAADRKPEASAMLKQISKKYAEARYYRVEAVEENETSGPFSHDWGKAVFTSINAPGNRYRFEMHTRLSQMLKISDGKTELNYNFDSQEYTREATPQSRSGLSKAPMDLQQSELMVSLELLKNLSRTLTSLHASEYLPDEDLLLGGKRLACFVIKARPRYSGGPSDSAAQVTFWIEKEKLVVRKQQSHAEGPLFAAYPQHFAQNQTILYPVMDLDFSSGPDALFSFQPPAGARLVHEFSNPGHPADKLAGTPSPAFKLQAASGKSVTLQDFHGKPVLLDFWATWCAPCLAAIEPLKKLHEESAGKGLVILSIDEDDEVDAGEKFFAEHKVPWSNFHDDGEVWRSFPGGQGVPFYVLIDANGKITFSRSGAEDSELRAAIVKLGINLQENKNASKDKP
jgi:thiol-disulfide isomerase/thioredoxin/outer membrane lipoprotein-sorting protein